MPGLLALPPELLEAAFLLLPLRGLMAVSATSRFFHAFLLSSPALQFRWHALCFKVGEEYAHGVPFAERLARLVQRERRWLNFQPLHTATLDAKGLDPGGASFGMTTAGVVRIHGWLGEAQEVRWTSTRLASEVGAGEQKLDGQGLLAHCSSESDDLMVFLECTPASSGNLSMRVRFLQLSTGRPHPAAAEPTCEFLEYFRTTPHFHDSELPTALAIAGNVLAAIVPHDEEDSDIEPALLFVFNWKTGDYLMRPYRCPSATVAFLSPDTLLVAHLPWNRLDALRIPASGGNATRVASFMLPELKSEMDMGEEDSFVLCPTSDGADGLILLTYLVDHVPDRAYQPTALLRRAALLELVDSAESNGPARTFSPRDWLPQAACWLDSCLDVIRLADSGQRVPVYANHTVAVLDANPWTVELVRRAAEAESGDADGNGQPMWRRLGIRPGVMADGTLRTEGGASLRLVRPGVGPGKIDGFRAFVDPPAQLELGYVVITAPTLEVSPFLHLNSVAAVVGDISQLDTARVLYFG
ncbi:hypothetical protein MIND_00577100 [Mycena indigotica]|uniref:F-box domain-containing protein n=1 Tax=Mycena indigotica TaxID=2126181 RepID=A0A8H6W5D9_9AGAR|nr:uncharacterized protein MIND_00577100 [Mycena indigotica]KAF7303481.1 hypothetical protein MIND_00577100 [Mycena indigotica]